MAAGPTPRQISAARRRAWKNLEKELTPRGLVLLRAPRSPSASVSDQEGGHRLDVALDLIRASNGEAALIWRYRGPQHERTLSSLSTRDVVDQAEALDFPRAQEQARERKEAQEAFDREYLQDAQS